MEELDIDFIKPRLSHAVVKEAEHLRVQELVKKIESHPHREALHADLQHINVYNPFSKNSKEMIRELGNVELFELCETIPKVQCCHCLLYWNQGIVYCTGGQCLIDSEFRRKFNKPRLDAVSIPNYVMMKRAQSWCSTLQDLRTKRVPQGLECVEKMLQESRLSRWAFLGIHERFLRDSVYRESQLAIRWTEQKCKEWDEFAKEIHTCRFTPEEKKRYQGQ